MTTLDQLLAGVRKIESGGNYSVVNSIGAVGAYQVMKANIPSWTKKALGYSMTWQAFRNSKSAQDKVARVILGGYYAKYGAAGAASMWFSGQPNPNSRASDGGNTVSQYVAKVLAAAGGSSGGGGGGYTAGAPVKVALDKDELAEQFGLSAALINSSSELKSLFNKAVSGSWSAAKFQASLKNSKWWKTQSSTLRKYITTKFTDPATWQQNWSAGQAKVNQLAVAVGFASQINSKGQSTKLLRDAIYRSVALGWTDARVKNYLGTQVAVHDGAMWGEAGESFDKLHEVAYLNGMKYSKYFEQAARGIARGVTTLEGEEAKIRAQAAAKYSAYGDQIKAGQNLMDLAAPYIKSTATILELPETDVDVFDSHVSKAMMAKPAAGAAQGTQMPLWQYENDLRSDPLWKKTNNAREGIMTVAHQVAKDFGMAF